MIYKPARLYLEEAQRAPSEHLFLHLHLVITVSEVDGRVEPPFDDPDLFGSAWRELVRRGELIVQ